MGSRTRRNRARFIHPDVTTWVSKVAVAGDSVPATALVANREFVKRCFVGGFWQNKMRNGVVLTFSTSTLTGAIVSYGSFTVTNNNFVNSDYSLNSGINPGSSNSTKYLDTGFNPSTNFPDDTSAQISIYFRTSVSVQTDHGVTNSPSPGVPRFLLRTLTSSSLILDCYSIDGGNRIQKNFPGGSLGLFTGNRTNDTTGDIFVNGIQYSNPGDIAQRTTGRPSGSFNFFRANGGSSYENRIVSYAYTGLGLTPAEEVIHYQAVQQMQIRLGRAV